MIGIYKITNKLDGKSYIGQSIHCGKRLDEHCKGNQFIDEVIQLEGIENFTFEILKEVNKEELSEWEDFYIMEYNTMFPNGYNKRWNTPGKAKKPKKNIPIDIAPINNPKARKIEALPYGEEKEVRLTNKQYLVYAYLVSISIFNPFDSINQYYVYKKSFQIKNACKILNITQPTWRNAITALISNNYIVKNSDYYTIKIPDDCVPLEVNLIKFLLKIGSQIETGGNIVEVYAEIFRYWKKCIENQDNCKITITKLKLPFTCQREKEVTSTYKLLLKVFDYFNLIEIKKSKKNGALGNIYIIKNISSFLPKEVSDISVEDIKKVLDSLKEK